MARIYRELKKLLQSEGGRAAKTGDGDLRDRLSKRFNISGRTLDRHVKMLKTPAEAQQLYRKGILSDSVMVALAQLTADQQKAVLAEVKKFGEPKHKNAAAKAEISDFRAEIRTKRKEAKKAAEAKTETANLNAGAEKAAGDKTIASDAETEGSDAAQPVAESNDAVHDDGPPPAAEVSADDGLDGDHAGETEDSHDNVATDEASNTVEVVEAIVEPALDTEEYVSLGAYRKVLEEYPDLFDGLVQQMDDVVGEAMDGEAAVVALQRIADSVQTLIEAEKTKAALAGATA